MGDIFRARKLLDVNTASIPVDISKDMSPLKSHGGSFDPNLIVILVALLCALICALAINYIIRWAFRCTQLVLGREVAPTTTTAAASPPPPPNNNKGLKRAAVQTLPTLTYAKPPNVELDCPICLADFADGETVRVLPKCNHSFHRQCIDRWLSSHSSCPTCRQNLLDVIAEKKGVATLLCSYQHTHACAQNGSIRIIIHQASEQETGQTSHSDSTPGAAAMDRNSETPETRAESAEIPNQAASDA